MGYDFKNISELNTFDFSNTLNTKDNIIISRDGLEFIVEGESIITYTQHTAKEYISTNIHWRTIKSIINEINVDYMNNTCTSTLNDLTVFDLGLWDDIIELRTIFEEIYTNPINTIKATFTNGSILIFNNDLTINCTTISTENIELFHKLSELFQNIKMSIMFKIN
jgi:hypothetical protein